MTIPSWSREKGIDTIIQNEPRIEISQQKLYLHSDKSDYGHNETIWFKIYLLDATSNSPDQTSSIVYAELIDPKGEIKLRRIIKTVNGYGNGDMKLPQLQENGRYRIRAYTNQMRNFDQKLFFEKRISIGSREVSDKEINAAPLISFYPEGGEMINGFYNRIAIKAIGEDGNPIEISGEIEDNQNSQITQFNTSKFGTGMFHYIPEMGKIYSAKIRYHGVDYFYSLPYAQKEGVIMRITEHRDLYRAVLHSSLPGGLSGLVFRGSQKQGPFYASKINGNGSSAAIKIPKEKMQPGIISFSLHDENDQLICERRSFFENPSQNSSIEFEPVNEKFPSENQMGFALSNSTSAQANISVSIQNINEKTNIEKELGIRSYIQIDSEISGKIQNSKAYMDLDGSNRKKNLDLLMLTTHQNQNKKMDDFPGFENETGLVISGKVINLSDNKPAADAEVFLSFKNSEILGSDKTKTDAQGRFAFGDLNFNSKTEVMLNAQRAFRKKKSSNSIRNLTKDLYLVLDSVNYPQTRLTDSSYYLNQNIATFTNEKSTLLEEVNLKGESKVKEDRYKERRMLYTEASYTLDFNDFPVFPNDNALTALRGRIPINNRGENSLLNSNGPLILLDGIPVSGALSDIPAFDIDFVDVIKGPRAAIYGSRASNGVIAVYTKLGNHNKNHSGSENALNSFHFIHEGISQPNLFSQSKSLHESDATSAENMTLFWEPNLILEPGEKKKFSFPAPSDASNYKINIEGVSTQGDLISTSKFFQEKSE